MLMSVSKLLPTTLTAQMLFMVSIQKKQTLKRFYKKRDAIHRMLAFISPRKTSIYS